MYDNAKLHHVLCGTLSIITDAFVKVFTAIQIETKQTRHFLFVCGNHAGDGVCKNVYTFKRLSADIWDTDM